MADPVEKLHQSQIKIPLPERRGLLTEVNGQSQTIVNTTAQELSEALRRNDPGVERVYQDIGDGLDQLDLVGTDAFLIIQLKGQSWVYFVDTPKNARCVSAEDLSDYTGRRALAAKHYKSENTLTYTLYEDGEEVEDFSSNGLFFYGVAQDPAFADALNTEEAGTYYQTDRWNPETFDWTEYPTRFHFLHETLVELDAYLTFFDARREAKTQRVVLQAGESDFQQHVERIDVVCYVAEGKNRRQVNDEKVEQHAPTTALANAVKQNDLEAVQAAIRAGADVDVCPRGSTSCLLCSDELPIVRVLLDAGADPDGQRGVESPLMRLAHENSRRSLRIAKHLLDAGANPDGGYWGDEVYLTDRMSCFPLQKAVTTGHFDMACLLLKYGADPSKETPFDLNARDLGHEAIDAWGHDPPDFIEGVNQSLHLLDQILDDDLPISGIPWPEALAKDPEPGV